MCGPETLSEEELKRNRADMPLRNHLDGELNWSGAGREVDKIVAPLLSAGNWGGTAFTWRNIEGFVNAASKQKWLEVHGGAHCGASTTAWTYRSGSSATSLKGENNGWDKQPKCRSRSGAPGTSSAAPRDEWPLARTQWTKFYLDSKARSFSPQAAGNHRPRRI